MSVQYSTLGQTGERNRSSVTSPEAAVREVRHGHVEAYDAPPAPESILPEEVILGQEAHKVIQKQYRVFHHRSWQRDIDHRSWQRDIDREIETK